MAQMLKCKICGDTEFTDLGNDIIQCRSCRHKMQKPKQNVELMERANSIRFDTKDFDKALSLYEEIIRMTPDEAEAYWGLVLCRYGIEYVKDSDGKYLPTCHRTIETSILDDGDYKMTLSKASYDMLEYYINEAKTIDDYQKKIKQIAQKEEPYDVFISFKATENGVATPDSLIAQELYYYLTKNLKLKVFFSNVTLKDKAGQEYEPIIYAALSSATVMIVVGTSSQYINSTWVKNEWSRYCRMASNDRNKPRYIISALHGMNPEELPTELSSRQAIDISELGAKEKLCSNIDSLIGDLRVSSEKKNASPAFTMEDVKNNLLNSEAENLCNSGFQKLSVKDFDGATKAFDKALEKKFDISSAYWGKLLATKNVTNEAELSSKPCILDKDPNFISANKFGSKEENNLYMLCAISCKKNQEIFENQDNLQYILSRFDSSYNNYTPYPGDHETAKLFNEYKKAHQTVLDNRVTTAEEEVKSTMRYQYGGRIIDIIAVIALALIPFFTIYATSKTIEDIYISGLLLCAFIGISFGFTVFQRDNSGVSGFFARLFFSALSAIGSFFLIALMLNVHLLTTNMLIRAAVTSLPALIMLIIFIVGRAKVSRAKKNVLLTQETANNADAEVKRLSAELKERKKAIIQENDMIPKFREEIKNLNILYGGITMSGNTVTVNKNSIKKDVKVSKSPTVDPPLKKDPTEGIVDKKDLKTSASRVPVYSPYEGYLCQYLVGEDTRVYQGDAVAKFLSSEDYKHYLDGEDLDSLNVMILRSPISGVIYICRAEEDEFVKHRETVYYVDTTE